MTAALLWEVFRWLLPFAAAAIAWWVRDRRKDRAASDVAERTVPAEIALRDTAADDARLVHLAKTWDTERTGLVRAVQFRDEEIQRQRAEIERQRAEVEHRDQLIARLREQLAGLQEQVEELQRRLGETTRELTSVRTQLDEIDDHHDREGQ